MLHPNHLYIGWSNLSRVCSVLRLSRLSKLCRILLRWVVRVVCRLRRSRRIWLVCWDCRRILLVRWDYIRIWLIRRNCSGILLRVVGIISWLSRISHRYLSRRLLGLIYKISIIELIFRCSSGIFALSHIFC